MGAAETGGSTPLDACVPVGPAIAVGGPAHQVSVPDQSFDPPDLLPGRRAAHESPGSLVFLVGNGLGDGNAPQPKMLYQ